MISDQSEASIISIDHQMPQLQLLTNHVAGDNNDSSGEEDSDDEEGGANGVEVIKYCQALSPPTSNLRNDPEIGFVMG